MKNHRIMLCPSCKKENPIGSRYCSECGTMLYKECPNCNTESPIDAKFCTKCGFKFDMKSLALLRYKTKLHFFDFCSVRKEEWGIYALVEENGKYGLFNPLTNEFILECEFEEYEDGNSYAKASDIPYIFLKKGGKWNLINPINGNHKCNDAFENLKEIECGKFSGEINGLWGRFNVKDGSTIIPARYEDIEGFSRHVKLNGLWGMVGDNGALVIPCEYIKLNTTAKNDAPYPSQRKDGKWGVFWQSGKVMIPFEYDEIEYHEPFGHSLYYLRQGNLWGLYFSGGQYYRHEQYSCKYSKEYIKGVSLFSKKIS